jgi:hypothetical protein
MTVDEEKTMMPTKDINANENGMVSSWGSNASAGFFAKRATANLR